MFLIAKGRQLIPSCLFGCCSERIWSENDFKIVVEHTQIFVLILVIANYVYFSEITYVSLIIVIWMVLFWCLLEGLKTNSSIKVNIPFEC